MEEIIVPKSVTTIGYDAFSQCGKLKRAAFQKGSRVRRLDCCCFHCVGLEEFVAPSKLRVICSAAFYECSGLRRVVLNEGLEALNDFYADLLDGYFGVF